MRSQLLHGAEREGECVRGEARLAREAPRARPAARQPHAHALPRAATTPAARDSPAAGVRVEEPDVQPVRAKLCCRQHAAASAGSCRRRERGQEALIGEETLFLNGEKAGGLCGR